MGTIPDDVMKLAYDMQTAGMVGVSFMSRQAAEAIARAILAERERGAAPDLLEALKAINDAAPDMPDALWRQVDAAIAKAEGRTP